MNKIKVVSNPYEKTVTFCRYDLSSESWITINSENNSNSKLVSAVFQRGFFPFKVYYILKEIELLTNQREKVTVFVCGGKGYFERLMKALGIEANEFKKYEIQSDNTKVVFVNIAHPSGWISADKLANSMKEG